VETDGKVKVTNYRKKKPESNKRKVVLQAKPQNFRGQIAGRGNKSVCDGRIPTLGHEREENDETDSAR